MGTGSVLGVEGSSASAAASRAWTTRVDRTTRRSYRGPRVMSRTALLATLFALVLAPAAAAGPVQLMPGVTYQRKLEWTAAGPVVTYVIRAPKPGGLYSLAPLLSNNAITGRETVSSMERRVSGQMTTVGVNG